MRTPVKLGKRSCVQPGLNEESVADSKAIRELHRGLGFLSRPDDHEPRGTMPVHARQNMNGVAHSLLGHKASGEREADLGVVERLTARVEDCRVESQRDHVDVAAKPLPTSDGSSLATAWIQAGDTPVGVLFVLRERRRKPLIDVLSRVHDDRKLLRSSPESLPPHEAHRFLVDVQDVGTNLADEALERLGVDIAMTVDIPCAADGQFEDRKRFPDQLILCAGVGPHGWSDEREINPGRYESAVALPMCRVASRVVHTENAHASSLCGSWGGNDCGAVPVLVRPRTAGSTEDPMRIVIAPSAYYPNIGGIEELTRQLARELGSRRHQVSVLTNRWPADTPRSEALEGVVVTRLSFPLPAARPLAAGRFLVASPWAAAVLVHHLRSVRPEIVHVIGAGPQAAYLGVLSRRLGARLVFTAQGELGFDSRSVFKHSVSLRSSLRRLLRTADEVTACSRFVLDELERFSPIRATPVVIPNGVAPADFDGHHRQDGRPYVLAVGRLVEQKGFDTLIEAVASEPLATLDLVIAGDGPERHRLESLAERKGIAGRVRFIGPVNRSQLGGLLAGCRVFALPSRGEPFGIALLEAMAAGIPSVATSAGGVTEFARDGQNALLVSPDDPGALATAIMRLDTDDLLRSRLSAEGRATADRLSWAKIATEYERVYAEALGTTSRRPTSGVAEPPR